MGLINVIPLSLTPFAFGIAVLVALFTALLLRIIFCQYFHPLARFPGPWWATSFSLLGALISIRYKEPQFLTYLVKRYGSKSFYILLHHQNFSCQFSRLYV